MTDSQASSSNRNLVFAADLGGTNLRAATVDQCGRIVARVKHPTPRLASDPAEIVRAIVSAAGECNEATKKTGGVIRAASVVVPGTVDIIGETVIQAPNLSSLDKFRFGDALQSELGWPVLLENDANAACVGEMWLGAARGFRNIICVTLGTGVGGGLMFNGELWRGTDGSAGEIGHTTVDPFSGVKCKCGNTGCLEVFASATAIVRMASEQLSDYPDTELKAGQLNARNVYEAGLRGDQLSVAVLKKMGTYLGIGLSNLVNLLNPEIIVIGGGVANGWELFEKYMNRQVAERAFPLARRVKIVRAECGDDAGLLGAANLSLARA